MVAGTTPYEIVKPTVELALERFELDFPPVWLEYSCDLLALHHADTGWKDLQYGSLYVAIRYNDQPIFRQYRLRARKLHTAIDRLVRVLASALPVRVTIYHFTPPPTRAQIAAIEQLNLRLRTTSAHCAAEVWEWPGCPLCRGRGLVGRFTCPSCRGTGLDLDLACGYIGDQFVERSPVPDHQSSIINTKTKEESYAHDAHRRRDPVRRPANHDRPIARGFPRHPKSLGLFAGPRR